RVAEAAGPPSAGSARRQGTNRDELIYRSYVQHGFTMREIADYLEVHYVSVSRSIKRYEENRKK
ncbi:MAG TPA: hypothetical protein VMZ49_02260, partial [Patescibacteria group bacterium]|nr:hypothetical protein [Patescibacteria group bacterium]